jgi:hypothetical protein
MRIRHLAYLRLMSRQGWLIIVTLFALLTRLAIYASGLLDSVERRLLDQRFSLRGSREFFRSWRLSASGHINRPCQQKDARIYAQRGHDAMRAMLAIEDMLQPTPRRAYPNVEPRRAYPEVAHDVPPVTGTVGRPRGADGRCQVAFRFSAIRRC